MLPAYSHFWRTYTLFVDSLFSRLAWVHCSRGIRHARRGLFTALLTRCHAVRTRKEEKKKVMSFYLRAGGACFLYTHCQALPAPPFRFQRCAASVFAGPLSSGQVPIRRGASGKVLFRHGAGRHPAVVSKHTPPRNYPYSYARFRVTIAPNFGCHPRCP